MATASPLGATATRASVDVWPEIDTGVATLQVAVPASNLAARTTELLPFSQSDHTAMALPLWSMPILG
jgi:hypothetical protein